MPFLLTFIGLLMIVTGARNTHIAFAKQVQSDFTGQGNFITWVVALGAVGSLGYISDLRTFSRYFMALIVLGLVLSNRGLFAQFSAALKSGPVAPVALSDNASAATSGNTPSVTVQTPGAQASTVKPSTGFSGWRAGSDGSLFGDLGAFFNNVITSPAH